LGGQVSLRTCLRRWQVRSQSGKLNALGRRCPITILALALLVLGMEKVWDALKLRFDSFLFSATLWYLTAEIDFVTL